MNCLIFDLDGTLVDSEPLCNQAFLNLIPELGWSVDELVQRYHGNKLAIILKDIEQRLGHPLPSDFETAYRTEVARLFDSQLKPTKGTVEVLSRLENPKCIASSGPLVKIKHSLQVTGLTEFFDDHLYSSYEVQSWKPEPDLFLYAARKMGVLPAKCIVIEDSAVGLAAAKAAGMHSIFYNPTGSVTMGDKQLSDFSELSALVAKIQKFL